MDSNIPGNARHQRFSPRNLILTSVVLFVASSCSISSPISIQPARIQTVLATQVVTQLVTQDVTEEETQIVIVPVIVTLAPTPISTYTNSALSTLRVTPAISPSSAPQIFNVSEDSDCLYGPGTTYLYKNNVFPGQPMEAIGRNPDATWLEIQPAGGWNPCWLQADLLIGDPTKIASLPIVYPALPYSNQYLTPDAIARRQGSEVTISWQAVWRSLDDYRGYLIEAWLCQAGREIFLPIGYYPALADNTGTLSISVTDESGCTSSSNARIYSVEKHGYSAPGKIFWPEQ